MSSAKLNIPWSKTHEALLEQQIKTVRDRMQHHADRQTRGTADTEDIDAYEFYCGFLSVLVSMRQPVTSRTLGAFTVADLLVCGACKTRKARGLDGQCPLCASERERSKP